MSGPLSPYVALWLLIFFQLLYTNIFFPMLIFQVLLTFRDTALVTLSVETSLVIYISPQFPGHCLLPMHYLLVVLTLRKSASGTNCSLAEVAESPALQQRRSRVPVPQSAWTPSGKAEAL